MHLRALAVSAIGNVRPAVDAALRGGSMLQTLGVSVLVFLIAFDVFASLRLAHKGWHHWRDTAANLTIALINAAIRNLFWYSAYFYLAYAAYEHSIFRVLEDRLLAWIGLFVFVDVVAYFRHLLQHKVRLLWAVHIVHHSSNYFNHSTDLRSSVLAEWCRLPTLLVFPLLGFSPTMLLAVLSFYQFYDVFNHNQWVGNLGYLERVFVTPSHHRVHHGRNWRYLDRNFGTFFIGWDHLFGTFEPERERVDFGITRQFRSHNPLQIYFTEFASMLSDLRRARNSHEAFLFVFGPPGWQPSTPAASLETQPRSEPDVA